MRSRLASVESDGIKGEVGANVTIVEDITLTMKKKPFLAEPNNMGTA